MVPVEQSADPLAPIADAQRIHALDAMRGLAILGVLVAYTVWSLGNPPGETWSATDHAVERAMDLFVDNKFLTMFAFLFGVGVAQQWRRWMAAGQDPVPLHLRRMGFLLAAGLLHGALLRNGDILAPYALLGLVLLGFRGASNRTIAIVAVLLTLVPSAVQAYIRTHAVPWPERPGTIEGGYVIENLTWLRYWYLVNPLLGWPRILALMLAGLMVGRAGILERLATSRSGAARLLAVTLPTAILARLALEWMLSHKSFLASDSGPSAARIATLNFMLDANAWPLSATYIAAILLLSQMAGAAALLAPLRIIGRMAFTNYLSQALVIVPLCLIFGWFDHVSPTRGVLLAASMAVVQLAFCTWWLAGHRMGPFERLWRGATYGLDRVPG